MICSPGLLRPGVRRLCTPDRRICSPGLLRPGVIVLGAALAGLALESTALASPTLSQRVTQIDAAFRANQQALAQYTWQQQELITVNGSVKKQALYQVKPVPGSAPSRTLVGRANSQLSSVDESYAGQIAALTAGYAQPQPGRLAQLLNQGNVIIKPTDSPNVVKVEAQGYLKPGDDVTIVFDNDANHIISMQVASYLTDQLNMVHINAQYAQLPDGVNHVSAFTVDGLTGNLVIQEQNLNYQRK